MASAMDATAVLLLQLFVAFDVSSALSSTDSTCTRSGSTCLYEHVLECPDGSRISITAVKQFYDPSAFSCFLQSCSGCCPQCWRPDDPATLLALQATCATNTSCSFQVARRSISCDVVSNEHSQSSTVEYDCAADATTLPSPTDNGTTVTSTERMTTVNVSMEPTEWLTAAPVTMETTERKTPETTLVTLSSRLPPLTSSPTPDTQRVTAAPLSGAGNGEVEGQRTAAMAGGVAAGVIILVVAGVLLFFAWRKWRWSATSIVERILGCIFVCFFACTAFCKRNSPSQTPGSRTDQGLDSEAPVNSQEVPSSSLDIASDVQYDLLGEKKSQEICSDSTYDHLGMNDVASYDCAADVRRVDVIGDVYDVARPDLTSEEDTYDDAGTVRRTDVTSDVYSQVRR